jgi:hypothetical protein
VQAFRSEAPPEHAELLLGRESGVSRGDVLLGGSVIVADMLLPLAGCSVGVGVCRFVLPLILALVSAVVAIGQLLG